MLEDSRAVLIAADVPPDGPFPQDEKIKDGRSPLVLTPLPFPVHCQHSSWVLNPCVPRPDLVPVCWGPYGCLSDQFLLEILPVCPQPPHLPVGRGTCTAVPMGWVTVPIAYSHVVENTAFFGDVVLRFPKIVHHYFDRNSNWNSLIRWGISFCNLTGVFEQGPHSQVLGLVWLLIPHTSCPLSTAGAGG